MKFSIEEFVSMSLSPNAYLLLYAIVVEDKELAEYLKPFDTIGQSYTLEELQNSGYLKLNSDFSYILRQKALDLRAQINPEPQFIQFWDKYHEVVKEWNKTDKVPAEKHWKKLTKSEKQLAIDNIQLYYDSLPVYNTGKPAKKARTYLADKNFLDIFKTSNKSRTVGL